jgi:hypothetical protein
MTLTERSVEAGRSVDGGVRAHSLQCPASWIQLDPTQLGSACAAAIRGTTENEAPANCVVHGMRLIVIRSRPIKTRTFVSSGRFCPTAVVPADVELRRTLDDRHLLAQGV